MNTINPFTAHTHQQGVTYLDHMEFAIGISTRLLVSVVAFALHAFLPFIDIAPRHDLEATMAFLNERNEWIESQETVTKIDELPEIGITAIQAV